MKPYLQNRAILDFRVLRSVLHCLMSMLQKSRLKHVSKFRADARPSNGFLMKAENEKFPSACLRWRQNYKFGNSALLFARLRQRNKLKCRLHMHDYFFYAARATRRIIFCAARATRLFFILHVRHDYFFAPRVALVILVIQSIVSLNLWSYRCRGRWHFFNTLYTVFETSGLRP